MDVVDRAPMPCYVFRNRERQTLTTPSTRVSALLCSILQKEKLQAGQHQTNLTKTAQAEATES